MKRTFKKNQSAFNIRLNEIEFEIIRELKDDFAVNISQAFKIFLKSHLDYLRKADEPADQVEENIHRITNNPNGETPGSLEKEASERGLFF